MTVAKEPGHRGERVIGVKAIAQGKPDQFGEPVVTCSCAIFLSHARLRVHWAPGFPCALCFRGTVFWQASGAIRVAGLRSCIQPSLRAPAKQSILSVRRDMDCFVASLLAMTVWLFEIRIRINRAPRNTLVLAGLDPAIHQSSERPSRRRWITVS
jgi:hypothetical protein